jgi:hypothetical protein
VAAASGQIVVFRVLLVIAERATRDELDPGHQWSEIGAGREVGSNQRLGIDLEETVGIWFGDRNVDAEVGSQEHITCPQRG